MVAGPVQPPAPEQPQSARSDRSAPTPPRGEDTPEQPPGERFGPLSVTRLVKDDGRALILYTDEHAQAELGDATAPTPERRDGRT